MRALWGPTAVPSGTLQGWPWSKPRWDLSAEGAHPTSLPPPSPSALTACQPCLVPSCLRRRRTRFASMRNAPRVLRVPSLLQQQQESPILLLSFWGYSPEVPCCWHFPGATESPIHHYSHRRGFMPKTGLECQEPS